MRTTPDESVDEPVARHRHEVERAGHGEAAREVGHEEDGALEDADEQHLLPS